MEFVSFLRELARHRWLVAVVIAVAALAALATAYKLPSLEKRSISVGAATGQILVDSDPSTLVAGAGTDQIAALGSRARVYAQYLSSRDAVDRISRETGIPERSISARGPFSQGTGIDNYQQQPAESRARDLVSESQPYRLVFEAQEDVPIITVYSTGPNADQALKLANSSFSTLEAYVAELKAAGEQAAKRNEAQPTKDANGLPIPVNVDDVIVRELGAPEGGTVGASADLAMMLLAFLAALGVQIVIVAIVLGVRGQRQTQAQPDSFAAPGPVRLADSYELLDVDLGGPDAREPDQAASHGDDSGTRRRSGLAMRRR